MISTLLPLRFSKIYVLTPFFFPPPPQRHHGEFHFLAIPHDGSPEWALFFSGAELPPLVFSPLNSFLSHKGFRVVPLPSFEPLEISMPLWRSFNTVPTPPLDVLGPLPFSLTFFPPPRPGNHSSTVFGTFLFFLDPFPPRCRPSPL